MLGKPCWSNYEMYPISGYFSKLGSHLTMLSDTERVKFYDDALAKAIIPNKSIVLDIGTGTGILAMLSAKHKAKKVYAIECGDIINIAKKIIADNNLTEKIELIRGLSTDIKLPKKVDIIVSETMGFTGLEENIETIMRDAKNRFGKESTVLIPDQINVHIALCTDRTVRSQLIDCWDKPFCDFDFSFLTELSAQNIFTRQKITDNSIVSEAMAVYKAILGDNSLPQKPAVLTVKKDSIVEGFAGWFSATSQQIFSLHDPELNDSGHWQQFFVPFIEPVNAKKGEKFEVHLSKKQPFHWSVSHFKNNGTKIKLTIQNDAIIKALKGTK